MPKRALIVVAAGLVLVTAIASVAPSASVKPGSLGTKCGVFPRPGNEVAADAPLARRSARLESGRLRTPRFDPKLRPRSSTTINSGGGDALHPDFGSPREYGIPYKVVGKRAKRVKVKFTAYGDESEQGQVPGPAQLPGRGRPRARRRSPRDRLRPAAASSTSSTAPSRNKQANRWDADAGVIWDLRERRAADRGLHLRRRRRAADLPRPGPLRRGQAGEINHAIRVTFDTTRDGWLHPASHCAGLDPSRPTRRRGDALPAQGRL